MDTWRFSTARVRTPLSLLKQVVSVSLPALLALPQPLLALPLPHTVTIVENTAFDLHLRITGNAIAKTDTSVTLTDVAGDASAFWRITTLKLEPSGPDELTITGTIFHRSFTVGTHIHTTGGDVWDEFDVDIHANDAIGRSDLDFDDSDEDHEKHKDRYFAFLFGNTTAAEPKEVIENWVFDLTARHIPGSRVPEPRTVVLVSLGILWLLIRQRPRKWITS